MTRGFKTLLIISGSVLVLAFIVWMVFAIIDTTKTTVTIHTSPRHVTITINDDKYSDVESGSDFSVVGDEASITVSREGFTDYTVTHAFTEDEESNTLYIALEPATFEAEQLLATPDEANHRESIVTDAYLQLLDVMEENHPILSELPQYGRYFTMSQGVSQQHPNDRTSFALYVDIYDAFEQEGRQEALEFLRENNYNPDDFEIIFRVEQYVTRDQEE